MLARMGQPADRRAAVLAAQLVGEPRCWIEALATLSRIGKQVMEGLDGEGP